MGPNALLRQRAGMTILPAVFGAKTAMPDRDGVVVPPIDAMSSLEDGQRLPQRPPKGGSVG